MSRKAIIREFLLKNPSITQELGERLYIKITEVIQSEVAKVTEQDYIDYMIQLVVIDRTFDGYMTEIHKEYALQAETHKKFTEVFGGKVFYLFSAKVGDKKEIANKEIIKEIQNEIDRLLTK